MKIVVLVMSIIVIGICRGTISEDKKPDPEPRHGHCRFPKGKHGSVRTEGCIKSKCLHGIWKPKLRTDICCYKQQVHKFNTVMDTIVSGDNCSSTTIGCGTFAQIEVNHQSCAATKHQVEKLELGLEQQIEDVMEKIENLTVNVTYGKQSNDIFKKVQEVNKNINEINKSIEEKDDSLSGKVEDVVRITEIIKNTTERQSEEIIVKINDVVQNIKNDKITIKNHVNDISRKIQNQTEELANNMKQKSDLVVGKIHFLNHTFENIFNKVSIKLENQTEKIVKQVKEVVSKFQTLENQSDNLSNQILKQLDNQTDQFLALENKVEEKLETQTEKIQESTKKTEELAIRINQTAQGKEVIGIIQALENQTDKKIKELSKNMENLTLMVKENIEDQNKMTLKMTSSLFSITELLEKHTKDTEMVEGVLITGGSGALTSTELFLPSSGKTCSLQSLPENRYRHSLDNLSNQIIMCGGYYTKRSCLKFLPTSSTGSWVYYATLEQDTVGHTTHSFEGELLLIASHVNTKSTEIVGKGIQYNLQQDTYSGCSIPDESSYILTGGFRAQSYMRSVVRYNMKGFLENLPNLSHGRRGHGCGFYMDKWNNKVLVVAGGESGRGFYSSTEVLPAGATTWQNADPLPRALAWPTYVNVGSYFLFIGGYDRATHRQILKFNGSWTEVGIMKTARFNGAATKIQIPGQGGLLDISKCF